MVIARHLSILGENQQSVKMNYKITTVFTCFNYENNIFQWYLRKSGLSPLSIAKE